MYILSKKKKVQLCISRDSLLLNEKCDNKCECGHTPASPPFRFCSILREGKNVKCAHIICDYGMRCCIYLSSSLNYRFDQGPMTSPPHLKKSWENGRSSTVCSHSPVLSPRSKFSNLFQSRSSLHLITWSLTPVSHNHQVSFSVIASHFPASSNCNASPSCEELSAASHSFFLQQHQSWLENPCIKKETEVVL